MGIKAALSKPFAKIITRKMRRWVDYPAESQRNTLNYLLLKAKDTKFGKLHHFDDIKNYEDFKAAVPINNYEGLKPYIEEIKAGQENVLWPGKPVYFSKTSGTTSGAKYIPISKESIKTHIDAARNALLCYIAETGKADFVDGKMIFLQGSPTLKKIGGISTGRLSGIVAHHVPSYLQKNRLPSFKTNHIEDWETKVQEIIKETRNEDMTLISGIPPWVQMYFDELLKTSGKEAIKDLFPNFSLFVYGGVSFEPYREKMEHSIGRKVDSIATYPASEGFIAFQNTQKEASLLLNLNGGIFYEFIPTEHFFDDNPPRYSLEKVELDKNYAVILNTTAGLWGYDIGDTVKFVSLKPYKIIFSGRVKHFTSAFGEHVIAEEIEAALKNAQQSFPCEIVEFHVAPNVHPDKNETAFHEWFVEFATEPNDLRHFCKKIDEVLQEKNTYYKDLIEGGMLQTLKIRPLQKNTFKIYMKAEGKLGGQNKVPRLSNDRKIAEALKKYIEE